MYGGAYRRPAPDETEVDNYEGVSSGSNVAVNLDGNYKPPHLAEVKEVTDTSFVVQWLKGGYKSKWEPWRGCTSSQIPKESVIYFDIQLDENGKLKKETAQKKEQGINKEIRWTHYVTMYFGSIVFSAHAQLFFLVPSSCLRIETQQGLL